MDHTPETNESLISRIKDPADAEAWTEFLGIYQPVILRMARKRGMQDADAQDVCQKVLLAVSLAIGRWEPRSDQPFRAWLGKIARNAVLNAITRRPRDIGTGLSEVADQLNEVADEIPEDSSELLNETRRELFRRGLHIVRAEFTNVTWDMFWETEISGRPVEEVAESVGRSVGAVYMARCRVMGKLREFVQCESRVWGLDASDRQTGDIDE
jgi:RNA polymerase sigma-70 factor (ECF subfamily)